MKWGELIRFRFLHAPDVPWDESCARGAPVPEAGGCAGIGCDSIPLTLLEAGETGVVSCLEQPGSSAARRLTALGVLPGAGITLIQRYPAFVFRMGLAEFAIDDALAGHIRVHPGQQAPLGLARSREA